MDSVSDFIFTPDCPFCKRFGNDDGTCDNCYHRKTYEKCVNCKHHNDYELCDVCRENNGYKYEPK